jgi:hypothetical protein
MTIDQTREQYLADIAAKRWCMYVPKHERPVLSALIKAHLDRGHTLSIWDSEEWVVKRSTDAALIRSQLGHTGEDFIRVRDSDGNALGGWSLIYNNGSKEDPMVVISDYSYSDETAELFDTICNDLTDRYGA